MEQKAESQDIVFKGKWNIRYLILWFMVAIYPLIVIPYQLPRDLEIIAPVSYFYAPRYVVLMIVTFIALMLLLKDRVRINHPAALPLGFFFLFAMLATILAPVKETAWFGLPARYTGFSTYFCCIILFILATQTEQDDRLLKSAVWCGVIVSILALLQFFGLNLVPHEPFRDRLVSYGTMGNPNFLGTYTAFLLPAAILLYIYTKKRSWLIATSCIYGGMLVSLTRGVWMAAFLGFLIIVWHCIKKRDFKKPLTNVIIAFMIVTAVLAPFHSGMILTRSASIEGELEKGIKLEESAGSSRMLIWRETIKLLPDNWMFGIGPDHLLYYGAFFSGKTADKAHNIYLEIAVTMGVFTLLAYLAFLSVFMRPQKSKKGFLFFVMISTYLVQGFFNIDVVMVMPVFWIILGLALDYMTPQQNLQRSNEE
ncbi:MAG: O-antigen ligase family protein [Syntrophaceticus sp.]|jgi:putative inorganic carbon (HCO3(-)) transporter